MQTLDRAGKTPFRTGVSGVDRHMGTPYAVSARAKETEHSVSARAALQITSGDNMQQPRILIACKIVEKELLAVLAPAEIERVIWVDAALHADLARLEEELRRALSKADGLDKEVRILFGVGCHPDIDRMLMERGVKPPPFKNCIEALLGERAKELEKNRTMIMTPGWVRAWPGIIEVLGWSEVDVRINLGRYERILVIDPGLEPLTDEELLLFFDLVQVPIEIEPLQLDHFRKVIVRLLSR